MNKRKLMKRAIYLAVLAERHAKNQKPNCTELATLVRQQKKCVGYIE